MSPALNERSQGLRATRVGASEVAALMGVDPYRGPMTVWARIVLGEQLPQTPRMAIGAALERPIAQLWAQRATERIRMNSRTRTQGNLAATADGFCLDRGGLLEIKWSQGAAIWASDELPESVRWQCVAQSAVYGASGRTVTVAALIGADLREYLVTPTRAERAEVRRVVAQFFAEHVEPGHIPMPLFPVELDAYLRLLQGADPEARRPATIDEQAVAQLFIERRAEAREFEARVDEARHELLELIARDPKPRVIGDGWAYSNTNNRTLITDTRGIEAA